MPLPVAWESRGSVWGAVLWRRRQLSRARRVGAAEREEAEQGNLTARYSRADTEILRVGFMNQLAPLRVIQGSARNS